MLGAEAGSVEWAQRHAEVVGLYQALIEQVLSLPEGDRTRVRALRYAPSWYRAVVWQSHWQHNSERPSNVLDDATLDHLGSIAEILALRFPRSAAEPTDEGIAHLRRELEEWLGVLTETSEVPSQVREEVAGQIQHVLWLLDNIHTFGAGPVVREARRVVGRVTEEAAKPGGIKEWTARIGTLIAAIALFTGVVQSTNEALEAVQDTITVVSEIVRGGEEPDTPGSERPALPSSSETSSADTDGNVSG